jgi:DHA2 family multidrug resistance protein
MTVIGRIMNKFDPRKFLSFGLLIGALTLWQFARLNLNAGYWDFFWPQFVQGISLAMLFVPLTTVSMSNIPRESMGNATSMFNLLRNLGGGIGIAGVSTLVTRYSQKHINMLGANITPFNPKAHALLAQIQAGLAHTSGRYLAQKRSYGVLFGMVERQATMLSYVDVFQLLAYIFLAMIPLVLIMKRPQLGLKPAPGGH